MKCYKLRLQDRSWGAAASAICPGLEGCWAFVIKLYLANLGLLLLQVLSMAPLRGSVGGAIQTPSPDEDRPLALYNHICLGHHPPRWMYCIQRQVDAAMLLLPQLGCGAGPAWHGTP